MVIVFTAKGMVIKTLALKVCFTLCFTAHSEGIRCKCIHIEHIHAAS